MDIGKSFTYSFEDKDWITKYLLGALISAIPILNFAWMGYILDIIRNVSENHPQPLPDWSDFGDKFVKGLLIWLAGLIYTLPGLMLLGIPLLIIVFSDLSAGGGYEDALAGALAGVGVLFTCLISLYFLVYSFFFPAVNIYFARHRTFGSCFHFKEIFGLVSENIGDYLIAWLVTIIFGFVVGAAVSILSVILSIIICIGWILIWIVSALATVWISTVYAHLFGQVAAEQ